MNTHSRDESNNRPVEIDPAILYWGTPVVLVSTLNEDGTANLAPMSSAWWLGHGCMLGLTESAQTVQNLRRTRECVLNLPSSDQAGAVDRIAKTTGANPVPVDKQWLGFIYEGDKFGRAGLTAIESTIVGPPRAKECPVQMEATVEAINPFGVNNPAVRTRVAAIELQIVSTHAHPSIMHEGDLRKVNPDLWRPLIMSFRRFYGLGGNAGESKLAAIDEELWRPNS